VTGAVRHPGVYHFKNGDRLCDAIHAAGGFKAGAAEDALNLADTLEDADQVFVPVQEKPEKPGAAVSAPYPVKTGDPMPRTRRRGRPAVIVRGTAATADPSAPPSTAGPTAPRRGRVIGKPAPLVVAENPATGDETGDPDGSATAAADSPVPAAPAATGKRASRSAAGKSASSSRGGKGAAKTAKFKNPGDGIVHLNSANAAQLEQLPGVGPAMSSRILEYRAQIGRFTAVEQLMDVKGIGDKKFAKMQPFLAL
jgi:competence protein ComEA